MLVTEFSTEVVAPPERFELFSEVTARSHVPNRLRSNDRDDFRANMRVLHLGELEVSTMSFSHLEIVRTAKLIRQYDPDAYQINYLLGQEGALSLAGRDTALRVGDLVVMDTSRPYHGDVHAVRGGWSHMTVQFPRKLLPLPEKAAQSLLGVSINGRRGMGGVFTRWLTDLNTRAGEFTPADVPTLASVTLDLLASALARCTDAEEALSPETRRNALRTQINTFVEQHLTDPDMTPQTIADAHHISLRHLQQLFAESDTSPAAWIRRRRLERCRDDLANPSLKSRPIQTIAARWGFADPAHFSRLFRATYEMTPREYRHLAVPFRRGPETGGVGGGRYASVPGLTSGPVPLCATTVLPNQVV
ncbi:helix-turn-helix domain-containing protein [Streptomyces sp. FXJ1.4098]|uniref:AraC-like ligand-binding domain-containing protein n=1 Tax=Streptomyces sp. NPDC020845 TaxID=3365096 RepID=UPI002995D64F|nr:helix-turn-helix domain-containing protein [Streptomyces sp. FXJ1.4098]